METKTTTNGGSKESTSNGGTSSSSDVKIDSKTFYQRLRNLYQSWENAENESLWKSADCLVLALGTPNDQNPYQKVTMVQSWLFGYELTETLIVFLKKSIHIVASQKKISIFESIEKPEEGEFKPFHYHKIDKSDNNKANFEAVITEMKTSKTGKHMGTISKEKYLGDFGKAWEEAMNNSGLEKVDISQGLSSLLAIKDAQELKNITYSAKISDKVLMSFLLPRIEKIIDKEEKETHSQLCEFTLDVFNSPEKISNRLTKDTVDYAYMPIIQSGGTYDLRFNATSNEDNLHFGTIVVSLGARYKTYCSNIARTYIIDPVGEQQKNYQLLLNVQLLIIKNLKPGVKFSQVYEKATQHIESEKPEMSKYFLKSCGYGIGLEFQESYCNINATNHRLIKSGMVLNVFVGFQNIESEKFKDDQSKVYSLMIGDTVTIDDEGKANVLTSECGKKANDVFYFISEDGDNMDDSAAHDPSLVLEMTEDLKAISGKKRESKRTVEEKRKDHQNMLAKRNLEETEAKIRAMEKRNNEVSSKQGNEDYSLPSNKLVLYPNGPSGFPSDVMKNKITIDMNKECFLLPIYGYIVPFHISTIKNVSKTEDYLRINFNTPTAALTPEQSESIPKQLLYVREVTYRIQDVKALSNYVRLIKEMRKRATTRETETRDKSTLIAQEKLILTKGRFPRLNDVSVRPTISGRRSLGNLEAHDNGLRFNPTGNKDKTPIDILYKNIKHALFQQAEQESMVVIHFHLYNALMIGKKKTQDVQFYSEISELSQSLDVTSRSMSDELEEERREREIKKKLNTEYQNFVKRVEDIVPGGNFEFDIPYRDLAFYGVPNVNTVLLQPSVQCLVNLMETPFFVLTLEEVEIACFERVSRALRNFDLVFVFKDYSRAPMRISIIPREYFETIKDWLDSCNIKFYMSERNLNWKRIMVEIKSDLKQWKEDGGWSFLDPQVGSGGEEEEEDSDEDYEPTDSEIESDSLSSQSSFSDYSEEESESSGEDWDVLDSKAAAADRRSNIDEVTLQNNNNKRKRDPPPPVKKSSSSSSSSSSKKK